MQERKNKVAGGVIELDGYGSFEITVPGVFTYVLPLFKPNKFNPIELEIQLEVGHCPDIDFLERIRTETIEAIKVGDITDCEGYGPLTIEEFREVGEDFDIPGRLYFKFPVFKPGQEPREMQLNFKAGLLPEEDTIMSMLVGFNERVAQGELEDVHGYRFVPLAIFKQETESALLAEKLKGKIIIPQPEGIQ